MAKTQSRPARWAAACQAARDALEDLRGLQEEYEEWQDNLPENLQDGPTAELLTAIVDLDLDAMESVIDEAEGLDLPRGFGRD